MLNNISNSVADTGFSRWGCWLGGGGRTSLVTPTRIRYSDFCTAKLNRCLDQNKVKIFSNWQTILIITHSSWFWQKIG